MRELSLNILDIAENSVKAKATKVIIDIIASADILTIRVTDNGKGMSPEFLKSCTDPFVTTRTTRKVGLGLPLLKMLAESAGGDFKVESELGKGTKVEATFRIRHVDRNPLGDIASTVVTLVSQAPECDFVLNYEIEGQGYTFDTASIKEQLDGIGINEPEILVFLGEMIKENLQNINGGRKL